MYGIYCAHEYWPEPTSGLYTGWVCKQLYAGRVHKYGVAGVITCNFETRVPKNLSTHRMVEFLHFRGYNVWVLMGIQFIPEQIVS